MKMGLPANAHAQLRNKSLDIHSSTCVRTLRNLVLINKMACLPLPIPTSQAAQIHRAVSRVITKRGKLCFI
eukprot:823115-Pelagomonas_calceolata.AAC.1